MLPTVSALPYECSPPSLLPIIGWVSVSTFDSFRTLDSWNIAVLDPQQKDFSSVPKDTDHVLVTATI